MISAEQRRLELSAVTMSLYLVPIMSMRIVRLLTNTSYGNFFIIIGGDFYCTFLAISQMNLFSRECIKQQQNSLTIIQYCVRIMQKGG